MMEKKKRGFAAMSKERVREIASKGGKAGHAYGTAHRFTSEEAKEAGRKGGRAPKPKRPRKRSRQLSLPLPADSEVRVKESDETEAAVSSDS